MTNDHRHQLLAIMSRIEQLIAEAERIVAVTAVYELMLQAAKQLADLQRMLGDVEEKFAAVNLE